MMAVHGCVNQNHFDDDDDDDLPLIFKRNGSTSKQNKLSSALKKPLSQKHDGSSGRPIIHGCVNQNHFDDDDDLPLIFKRHGSTSKQNKLSSALKKPLSQKHDGSSGRPINDARASDRQNSNLPKTKLALPVKLSEERSNVANSKASIPDQPRYSSDQDLAAYDREKKPLNKSPVESAFDPNEDSDDNIPLSSRMPASGQKSNSSHVSRDHNSSNPSSSIPENTKISIKNSADDSGDEKPLSSKLSKISIKKSADDSVYERPLYSKLSKISIMKSADDSGDEKPLSSKLSKISMKKSADDSGDERPLSYKISKISIKKSSDDSGDERPLSSKLSKISIKKSIDDSGDERPLSSKLSKISIKKSADDSGDERPLHSKISKISMKKSADDSGDERPLTSKISKISIKKSADDSGDERPLYSKISKISIKKSADDSGDERPLYSKLSKISIKKSADDSGDERPLSSKLSKISIKKSADDSGDERPLYSKVSKISIKKSADDSGDERPLSSKLSKIIIKKSADDSGDERPLSSKLLKISIKKSADDSGDERPLYSKISKVSIKKSADDSGDERPLSSKLSKISIKKSADDSGDERPLSYKISKISIKKSTDDSGDERPLYSKISKISIKKSADDLGDERPLSSKLSKICIKKSTDDSGDERPLSSKLSKISIKKSADDSGDEKPLYSKLSKISIKKSVDDSGDEKPLSSKLLKSCVGASSKTSYDSDDEKPLFAKFQKIGYNKRDSNNEQSLKSSTGLNKRPTSEVNRSSPSSSVKKLKISSSSSFVKVKQAPEVKKEEKMDADDHIPIAQRMKKSVPSNNRSSSKKPTKVVSSSFKKTTKKSKKVMKNSKYSKSMKVPPGSGGGKKWTTLEHNGVIFPPLYKPHGVKMLYNGEPVDLTPEQEEVATMFAVMKDTEYATKETFIDNFMNDWRVILGRNHVIKKFELCDFNPIYEWHEKEKEKKKQMSTEEKKALKEEKLKQEEKYMWAVVDGVKEKVGNFRVEPPGLFRGRGEHPKMGKLKRRICPSDITINIGKGAPIPECPIPGERWKEIKHDNTVTWLAFWNDPINSKESKYVFLAASSSLKGQSDKEKYEKARMLKNYIDDIRSTYTKDFGSKDISKQQIAVATYLIDKLALRAGNEKDDDEADTVGCCTLKVENVTLLPPNKLQFDFLGKDSIRYFNTVEVELNVYKAIAQFQTGKKEGEDLFDKLDTSKLNAHLKELMPGLTAKVFRTYNASITLDDMLNKEMKDGNVAEKIAVYQHANKEVAIICNHQRSVSKSHSAQMSRMNEKMAELKSALEGLKVDLSRAKKGKPPLKDADGKTKKNLSPEAIEKKLTQAKEKIEKLELEMKIKEDLKTVALGTSKINYLDPRISVAWCKRHEVPIEKIFSKSLLAKFAWAMDVEPTFRF